MRRGMYDAREYDRAPSRFRLFFEISALNNVRCDEGARGTLEESARRFRNEILMKKKSNPTPELIESSLAFPVTVAPRRMARSRGPPVRPRRPPAACLASQLLLAHVSYKTRPSTVAGQSIDVKNHSWITKELL
ncbi:hypothetical protein EVAR_10896_1 [Eumeta japonica]|uniref:Uncharacterized protein n=1 Tax=Eumeta variegata TaxID=151549 RepID=A0A4C1US85_EUMVA|nr:hypothetical protein EVAR_10896_1 [Eumeta japonica]